MVWFGFFLRPTTTPPFSNLAGGSCGPECTSLGPRFSCERSNIPYITYSARRMEEGEEAIWGGRCWHAISEIGWTSRKKKTFEVLLKR